MNSQPLKYLNITCRLSVYTQDMNLTFKQYMLTVLFEMQDNYPDTYQVQLYFI